jgi:hypothetical protein
MSTGEAAGAGKGAGQAAFATSGGDDEDDGFDAAKADTKVRFFLKVKQGPLLRYFNHGYEARWFYLVDQHLLDFDNPCSAAPSRIYELRYPQTVCVRNGTDIQITFTKSNKNHKTARLYLRAETEEEALDWFDLIDLVSRKKIGTCKGI